MLGAMQDWDLRVSLLIDHAAREHGSREIVSGWADGSQTRSTWTGIRRDALKLVQALRRIGVGKGDRVATLAMNHARHLVAFYGIPGAGAVIHTVNPRLFDDQLDFIVNHAEDRVLIYDAAFAPIVERMKPRWPTIEHYVCFDSAAHGLFFEDWIGAEDGDAEWVQGEERDPCMLCYTSGTTGNPKGVLYTHRSNLLHTYAVIMPQCLDLDSRAVVLPVVPMFHANQWGLPWAAAAVGAKLVYCASNQPDALCALMRQENVDYLAGVPTVWMGLLQHIDATGQPMPPLKRAMTGGSAMPVAVIERLMREGIRVAHAWGMTEISPVATVAFEPPNWDDLPLEEQAVITARQGKALFGIQLRTVDLDDPARVLPRDGQQAGALQVRGPWVVKRYFKAEEDAGDADQWFDTGDVAVLHADGTLQLTDRTKDVIKSGGEWISSVDLENAAVAHPGVAEAAAIGITHPRWEERPLLVVVRKPGVDVCADELRSVLAEKVAKWWLPDAIEFVDDIPHTGTGKISKKDLRERFRDYRFAG